MTHMIIDHTHADDNELLRNDAFAPATLPLRLQKVLISPNLPLILWAGGIAKIKIA